MEEVKELSLIQVADNFKRSVQGLEELAEKVPTLPTEQLGTGYAMVKAFEKNFETLIKAVRDEFIGTQDENGNYLGDGRLFKEATEEDDKGNPMLELEDGVVLKASKSEKIAFNEEKAMEILEEHDLVTLGTDLKVEIVDTNAFQKLVEKIEYLPEGIREELKALMLNAFNFARVPNKDKIESLITLGQLPSDVVDDMFDVKVGYSLLISKNPYSPKKKKSSKKK